LQRSGDAHGTLLHRRAHQLLHLFEFGARWAGASSPSTMRRTWVANVAGQVDAHTLLLEAREVAGEVAPVGGELQVLKRAALGLDDCGR